MNFLSSVYYHIFGTELKHNGRLFIKNIWVAGVGYGFWNVCNLVFQVVVGRILGPVEYGKYALVYSIAMFLHIPMIFGLATALVKYNAEQDNYGERVRIISTTIFLVSVFSFVSVCFFLFFSKQFSEVFSVSPKLFNIAAFFAFFYYLHILCISIPRSLLEMKKLSFYHMAVGLVVLLTLATMFFLRCMTFKSAILSLSVAYGIGSVFTFVSQRKYLRYRIRKYWLKRLLKYGGFAVIGGISSAFYINFGKIAINKFLTIQEVGIYHAYYTCFVSTAVFIFHTFNVVFFPTVSKYPDKAIILRKINRLIPYLIVVGFPAIVLVGALLLKLYGKQYPFDLPLALLFACSGICFFIDSTYVWLIAAVGMKGIRMTSFVGVIRATVAVILSLILIPAMGIKGAAVTSVFCYLVSTLIIFSKKRYCAQQRN
jgi:O-antigen/teichoic acid export membrane protein